jgi:5'-3' exonuclease
MKKKLLLVDGYNAYIRNFAMLNLQAEDGRILGGTIGFLNSLRHAINANNADSVILVWDEGQSLKRKRIYADYKVHRTKKARKVLMPFDDLEQQDESFGYQLGRLKEYLKYLPVNQIQCPNVEADDIIAFICKDDRFSEYQKIIYSTDKDFLQLIEDGETTIYHPIKKKYITTDTVLREYGVYPWNFPALRSLTGDPSDNIMGIKGVGFQSSKKYFPLLQGEKQTLTDKDLVEYCEKEVEERKKPYKVHELALEESKRLEANYKIIQLIEPEISLMCMDRMDKFISTMDKNLETSSIKLRMLLIQDTAIQLIDNFDAWHIPFKSLWYRIKKNG